MKVILLQDIKALGKKGELAEVSEGYGRNYLLPKKLAKEANAQAMNEYILKLRPQRRRRRRASRLSRARSSA